MLHRVGVISDTHVPRFQFPEAVYSYFDGVERIVHAGDLSILSVLTHLEAIAPVTAVQGNVEHDEVVMELPVKREIQVGYCKLGIVHILGDTRMYPRTARLEFPDANVVIFGHSHVPYNQEHAGQLLFNPGSATDRRRQPACSLGMLYIDDEAQTVRGEIITLS